MGMARLFAAIFLLVGFAAPVVAQHVVLQTFTSRIFLDSGCKTAMTEGQAYVKRFLNETSGGTGCITPPCSNKAGTTVVCEYTVSDGNLLKSVSLMTRASKADTLNSYFKSQIGKCVNSASKFAGLASAAQTKYHAQDIAPKGKVLKELCPETNTTSKKGGQVSPPPPPPPDSYSSSGTPPPALSGSSSVSVTPALLSAVAATMALASLV